MPLGNTAREERESFLCSFGEYFRQGGRQVNTLQEAVRSKVRSVFPGCPDVNIMAVITSGAIHMTMLNEIYQRSPEVARFGYDNPAPDIKFHPSAWDFLARPREEFRPLMLRQSASDARALNFTPEVIADIVLRGMEELDKDLARYLHQEFPPSVMESLWPPAEARTGLATVARIASLAVDPGENNPAPVQKSQQAVRQTQKVRKR